MAERASGQALTIQDGRGGLPKAIRRGRVWSKGAEAVFLDALAATCNVTAAMEEAGISKSPLYRRRRSDRQFADHWREALEIGYERLEAQLLAAAECSLSGRVADADAIFAEITGAQAISILHHYRATVKQGRPRTAWRKNEKPIEAVRASIARKIEAIARAHSKS